MNTNTLKDITLKNQANAAPMRLIALEEHVSQPAISENYGKTGYGCKDAMVNGHIRDEYLDQKKF